MKISVIVATLAALCILTAFWLVWLNRASEKILTAVIPIAVAAVVGIILSIFVFGGQSPVVVRFQTSFQYQTKSKLPCNFPPLLTSRRFMNAAFAPSILFKNHSEYFSDPADSNGQLLYHDFLQWEILNWMSMVYGRTWQSESVIYESPVAREGRFGPFEGATEPSKIFSSTELADLLTGNRFVSVDSGLAGLPITIAMPPGTSLTILAPTNDTSGLENGEIRAKNDFCTLSIRTQRSSYIRGVGYLKDLVGMTDEENEALGTASYVVRVEATFSRIRSGDPKMRLYKSWAVGLAEGLKDQFDEEIIWQRTKADYLFHQQVQQLGPLK